MAGHKLIDWNIHGEEALLLYISGLSVRQVCKNILDNHSIEYKSGTLTNYLGRRGVLRTKSAAHTIRRLHVKKTCEACKELFSPASYRQRWCDVCTGTGKYRKRLTAYGLSAPVLERMLARQNNCCKVCDRHFPEGFSSDRRKTLYIDHDHVTGKVRGLVCPKCNNGLSYLDRPEWLKSAMRYMTCEDQIFEEQTVITRHHHSNT